MKKIDVAAASDALARLDEGEGREGDEQLAALCDGCVPGGTGPLCEEHSEEEYDDEPCDDLDALWQAIGDSR